MEEQLPRTWIVASDDVVGGMVRVIVHHHQVHEEFGYKAELSVWVPPAPTWAELRDRALRAAQDLLVRAQLARGA